MKTISPRLRRRIDAVAIELFDIAKTLNSGFPALAAAYSSLSRAIDCSHYCLHGMHRLSIDVPNACHASVSNARDVHGSNQVTMFRSVPIAGRPIAGEAGGGRSMTRTFDRWPCLP
jgi:hypothetical protein